MLTKVINFTTEVILSFQVRKFHKARPEVTCVLRTHSIAGCAVSMQRDGLLPLNQHAL